LIFIFLTPKRPKTHIILAQNFRDIDADFEHTSYVFLILIIMYLARKIMKTHSMLAQNFRENNAFFE
jgi:hypothetical protein